MSVVEILKVCPLFAGFTDTGLQIIASIAVPRTYPNGVPLFAENMVAESLIIISAGTVKLTTKKSASQEVALGNLGPTDYLGEIALIHQGQRLCTATATSAVQALEIRHADFQKLLAQKPQACIKLLMGIVSRFGQKVSDGRELFKALL